MKQELIDRYYSQQRHLQAVADDNPSKEDVAEARD